MARQRQLGDDDHNLLAQDDILLVRDYNLLVRDYNLLAREDILFAQDDNLLLIDDNLLPTNDNLLPTENDKKNLLAQDGSIFEEGSKVQLVLQLSILKLKLPLQDCLHPL